MSVPTPPSTPDGARYAPPIPPAPAGVTSPAGYATPGGVTPPAGYAPPAGYGGPTDPAMPGAPIGPPPSGDARPKTLAIIALVLAVVGLVLAFIPFVTWFSGAVLLAAFIVGLVALIAKKHGGTGFSVAALIVSVVGWIVSIVMTIASFGILGQAAIDDAVREDTSSSDGDTTDTGADDTVDEVADDREELVLVESAFGRSSLGGDTWWYVVVFDNPNEDHIFDFAEIDVEALDAAGTILDSSTDYRTILSGRTAISGTFFSVGDGEITELGIRGPEATEATRAPLAETGAFTVEGVQATTDTFSTSVHGTVSADFEDEQEFVQVVVVARNAAGAIIGAESAYVDRLPNDGSKVQFEATFFDELPADTTYEAFAAL